MRDDTPGERIESLSRLKRRIYMAILGLGAFAAVVGLAVNELLGIDMPVIRAIFILILVFMGVMAWFIRMGKFTRILEEALYGIPVITLMVVLYEGLYRPASLVEKLTSLEGAYLWFPTIYTLIFLIHEGRSVLPRAVALYITSAVIITLLVFVNRLKERLRETQIAAEKMKTLAHTNPLTGAYNRRRVEEALEREMERRRRYNFSLSLIIFDIDNFKQINDAYEHEVFPVVLVEISRLFKIYLRASDHFFEVVIPVSASFGVSTLRPDDSGTTLVKRADIALYRAKIQGKNRVEVETSSA